MTNELGRELTTAEAIAVATGQTTIMDIVHGEALNMDIEWNAQIHCVMPSGVVLTWGDLWYEMHRPVMQVVTTSANPWIPGVKASSNMFA